MKDTIKTAIEVASLVEQLAPSNQAYVLNTINALLYSQKVSAAKCEKIG